MEENLPPFLKQQGDSILFNGDGEFYFYIPEILFTRELARFNGEYISLLGIMSYAMKLPNGKMSELKNFNYPTRFLTKPYKTEKLTGVKLTKETDEDDYRVLCYKKGDAIIVDINVPKDIENCEDFLNMFIITGRIPSTIPYDQLQNYIVDNYLYNGYKYKISLQMFGIIISEICRSKNDISVPFRLSKETNMKNYKAVSIKTIPKLISSYSAFTSENINEAIVYASMNSKKVQIPLERIVTGEDVR